MSADRYHDLEAKTDEAAHAVFSMPQAEALFAELCDEDLGRLVSAARAAVEATAQAMATVLGAADRRTAIDGLKLNAMAAVSTLKVVEAERARREAE